jgi:hypothetical protein
MENQHKLDLMPIKEQMAALENAVGVMLTMRATPKEPKPNMTCAFGTAYKKEIFSATVTNKEAFQEFAFSTDWKLLDIRASETGIKEYIDKNVKLQSKLLENEKIPILVPGIKTERLEKVIFRAK